MSLLGIPINIGTNFLQALGWALLNSLWQMAFLWVIYQVALSFKNYSPRFKSRFAAILLHAGFSWFLFTLISHWLIDPSAPKRSLFAIGSFEDSDAAKWNDQLQFFLPYASLAYLALLIMPIFQFVRNYKFVQVIRKYRLSKCNVDIRMFVKRFAARMGIRKPVNVYLSDIITSPVTIGWLKPIILLPVAAITQLSTKQVEAVLLHELAHIRRYDYFINLLINFINTVLYFNPFVKLFVKTVEREREKSCDEIVIQFQYDPHGYAAALLELEKNNHARQRMAIGASGQKYDLLQRVERILGIEKRKAPDFKKLGGLLAGLVCIIGLNALFIFGKPMVGNSSFVFSQLGNPFYHLAAADEQEIKASEPVREKIKNNAIAQIKKQVKEPVSKKLVQSFTEVNVIPGEHYVYTQPEGENAYAVQLVDARVNVVPELKKYQVAQVKQAVEATKKVLEQSKWKQVEKTTADALTSTEKEMLKEKYYYELSRLDWKKLENKLKVSYNDLNWDNINFKLSAEMTNIKLDSLTVVYNLALSNLGKAEGWMKENNCSSIPDTDLQLKEVKDQEEKLNQQLRTIKAIRNKKIIHL
jgi:bla regulator protein BlaR1